MQIHVNLTETQALLDAIYKGGTGVLTRAINRTLTGVRTDVTTEVTKSVNLTKSFVQKQTGKKSQRTFFISKASTNQLRPSGYIEVKGANVPLIQYSNQRGSKFRRTKRVSVMVQKSRGRTRLRHALPMKMPSGHRGLFEFDRGISGTGRRSIKELYGSRVPDVLSNKKTFDAVTKKAQERLDKNVAAQIDWMLTSIR